MTQDDVYTFLQQNKNVFFVKHTGKYPHIGMVRVSNMRFPKELIGKRIRIKIEIVDPIKKRINTYKKKTKALVGEDE